MRFSLFPYWSGKVPGRSTEMDNQGPQGFPCGPSSILYMKENLQNRRADHNILTSQKLIISISHRRNFEFVRELFMKKLISM
jgi:hypothetical protein